MPYHGRMVQQPMPQKKVYIRAANTHFRELYSYFSRFGLGRFNGCEVDVMGLGKEAYFHWKI